MTLPATCGECTKYTDDADGGQPPLHIGKCSLLGINVRATWKRCSTYPVGDI